MADGDFDMLRGLRDGLSAIAESKGEYAGIPMPLDGEQLVIHPSYEFAIGLGKIGEKAVDPNDEHNGVTFINRWWSCQRSGDILIWRLKDGTLQWGIEHGIHHIGMDLHTLGCADAWGLEQETKALELLGSLLKPRAMRQYLMTGMFLERSKRSGVVYIFRRLKPAVACKADRHGEMKILACLCAHPIAHYAGSWAGAMCPTDDVVAHLQMMRADEHLYWRRCNQHPPYRPEAGL